MCFPCHHLQGPQCVVLVPTRELGVQIALLVYRLFGGNPTAVTGIPGQPGNMFRYTGPRGLQARRTHPAAACPQSVFVHAATATRSHACQATMHVSKHHALR
jgi:hypothetical protein